MLNELTQKILFQTYETSIRWIFRYHPNVNNIIEGMRTNQLTSSEIDDLFAEADMYAWKEWGSKYVRDS